MRSREDRDWDAHAAQLRKLGEEGQRLVEFVEWTAALAEEILDSWVTDYGGEDFYKRARFFWENCLYEATQSIVVTDLMVSEALYLFVTYWHYGEHLAGSLTLFETTLLQANTFSKLAQKEKEAAQYTHPVSHLTPIDPSQMTE